METNVIYCGDNLEALPKYIPDESVDLIYIDPPFNTSRQYEVFWGEAQERRAFDDRFGDVMTYLDWMRPRLHELHRVLKPTGSLYYHCDWHASHYVKVELDRIFGPGNFRNEIVWRRADPKGHAFSRYPSTHDVLLYYGKSDHVTWNTQYTAYDPEYIASHYSNVEEGTGRRYTLSDCTNPNKDRPNLKYEWHGVVKVWRWTQERMQRLHDEGRLVYTKSGAPRYKRYLDEMPGAVVTSIWDDIPFINSQASERLGYPTQKPLALLERTIRASSDEGQVILDAFCGCGTTLEAAAKLKRRWIGIDVSPTACRVMSERLETRLGLREGEDFRIRDMPKNEADLRRMPHFEFQNWAVIALGGIPNRIKSGDFGIDGKLYVADAAKKRTGGRDLFGEMDNWYPIQVKQVDRVGRPDIDQFQTTMRRDRRLKGYFVGFGFSKDAMREILRANAHDSLDIVPVTVKELLEFARVTG